MPEKPTRLLLVEGPEDREVVYQFCNYHSIDNRALFEVVTKEGYESLRDDLTVRPRTGPKIIGAIVDADVDPKARWQSLRTALLESDYRNLPLTPTEGGTIIPGQGVLPSMGIWLMPNNRLAGILEDFLTFLISEGDVLLEKAVCCVERIPKEHRRFANDHRSKALLHTWLAWQEQPGTPLGLALTRRYLNADHALAMQFMHWLTTLFPAQSHAQGVGT
ncbi:MAG: DUF3226 domain-containing protein [Thermodesulfobacteriota bacterium]